MKSNWSAILHHPPHPCSGLSHVSVGVNLRCWLVGVIIDRVGYLPHSKWMYHLDVMILCFHVELSWITRKIEPAGYIKSAPPWPTKLPDGSAFFIGSVSNVREGTLNPVHWNPGNKVVQDHRDGTIIHPDTDIERSKRGLRVPWKPEYAEAETSMPDIP